MLKLLKVLLPLLVLAGGAIVAQRILSSAEPPATSTPEHPAPLVRGVVARASTVRLDVTSQGTVRPRTESRLLPRVSGAVEWVSPSFVAGGFFELGEVLVRLDRRDHELAIPGHEAEVARAELALALEEREAQVARTEWEAREAGPADALLLRVPQLARARAELQAARATLARARLDLERTSIAAPYDGRVASRSVDVGQYVQPGQVLAEVYAVDRAEVRLPVPDDQFAFLELPAVQRGTGVAGASLPVTLRAPFGGRLWTWEGRVVRSEGEIDPENRMAHLVAEVDDPYGVGDDGMRPPLQAGLFVEALIHGRLVHDVIVLPRAALRGDGRVLVVDEQGRLRGRDVDVLRLHGASAVLRAGVSPGEIVCVSILETATEGMAVRVELEDPAP